jgi:hypothetical protein
MKLLTLGVSLSLSVTTLQSSSPLRADSAGTGRIDNVQWQAAWSWGGAIYWAVREGQGQIGWP